MERGGKHGPGLDVHVQYAICRGFESRLGQLIFLREKIGVVALSCLVSLTDVYMYMYM